MKKVIILILVAIVFNISKVNAQKVVDEFGTVEFSMQDSLYSLALKTCQKIKPTIPKGPVCSPFVTIKKPDGVHYYGLDIVNSMSNIEDTSCFNSVIYLHYSDRSVGGFYADFTFLLNDHSFRWNSHDSKVKLTDTEIKDLAIKLLNEFFEKDLVDDVSSSKSNLKPPGGASFTKTTGPGGVPTKASGTNGGRTKR